jgi:hypothetical protein
MTSQPETLLAILQTHFNPHEEGWLWVALYAEGHDGGVVNQIEGEYEEPRETAHALGDIINQIGPDHVYLALCRNEGRPAESDRELWRELRGLIDPDRLIDMVVFSARDAWSMRAEDAQASASSAAG